MGRLPRVTAIAAGLVAGAIFVLLLFVDGIVRSGIERGATFALGVETTLDSASIKLFGGAFGLSGLAVANPPGFEGAFFLKLADARLDLEMATLREPTVRVPLFEIDGIEVDLDKRGRATNYGAILDNLARFESAEAPEPEDAGPGKRFIIEDVVIRNVLAHVRVIGGDVPQIDVVVPEVRIDDLGGAGEPLTTAEITDVVVKAVLASIAKAGAGLPGGVAGALSDGLGRLSSVTVELPDGGHLADAATEGTEAATDAVSAGANAAADAAEASADAVQGAGSALKELGGDLLGDE